MVLTSRSHKSQAAGKYLGSINRKLASALSLTFGFHYYMNAFSGAEYSVKVKPKKSCYSTYSVLGVKVNNKSKVSVPLLFGIITDLTIQEQAYA